MRLLIIFSFFYLISSQVFADKTFTCDKYSDTQVICTTSFTRILSLKVYEKIVQNTQLKAYEAKADSDTANQILADVKSKGVVDTPPVADNTTNENNP